MKLSNQLTQSSTRGAVEAFIAKLQIMTLTNLESASSSYVDALLESKVTSVELSELYEYFKHTPVQFSGGGAMPNVVQVIQALDKVRRELSNKREAAERILDELAALQRPKLPEARRTLSQIKTIVELMSVEQAREFYKNFSDAEKKKVLCASGESSPNRFLLRTKILVALKTSRSTKL